MIARLVYSSLWDCDFRCPQVKICVKKDSSELEVPGWSEVWSPGDCGEDSSGVEVECWGPSGSFSLRLFISMVTTRLCRDFSSLPPANPAHISTHPCCNTLCLLSWSLSTLLAFIHQLSVLLIYLFLPVHCDLEERNPTFSHWHSGSRCSTIIPSLVAYSLVVRKISSGQRCDTQKDGQPGSNIPSPNFVKGGIKWFFGGGFRASWFDSVSC